jgi:hypothetical protein
LRSVLDRPREKSLIRMQSPRCGFRPHFSARSAGPEAG